MALCRIARVPDGRREDYERTRDLLRERGTEVLEQPPEGMLLHVAMTTADGLLIIEVWESKSQVESAYAPLRPLIEQAGIPLGEVTEYHADDVLNLLALVTVPDEA